MFNKIHSPVCVAIVMLEGANKVLSNFCLVIGLVMFINGSATFVNASHFRGGTAWWKPAPGYTEANRQIQVEYNLNWRLSYDGADMCTDGVTKGLGNWESNVGDVAADFSCIEHNVESDWMVGYNRINFTFTQDGQFFIWYGGRCWVNDLYESSCEWRLEMMGILGIRSDTGKPNSSPKTGSLPVVKMQRGCPTTFQIPVADEDKDSIRCYFPSSEQQCGSACYKFPHFSLQENCQLTYNGGGLESLIAVAIVIEDHPTENINIQIGSAIENFDKNSVLSSVPLQFLVDLQKLSQPCAARPNFTENTPPPDQVISTLIGVEFTFSVYAEPSTDSENISDITFVFPFGASKTQLEELPNKEFRINVSWIPTQEQSGSNIICFTATDTARLSSVQRCITVIVGGATSPCRLNNGGCSDICLYSDSNYICACPRPCWHLSTDGRTCRPNLEIECYADSMNIVVEKCASDESTITIGHTPFSIVEGNEERGVCSTNIASIDDVHINFTIPFDDCNFYPEEDFWTLKYHNVLRMWGEDNDNSLITRGAWYLIPISCQYSKLGNLTASFQPVDRNIELIEIPEMGSFSFFMEFYKNSSFEDALGPYDPLEFTVNSDIFFSLRAVGGVAGMELFTIQCVARPDGGDDQYYMIQYGCILDTTMVRYDSSSSLENRFSIKAFKFRDNFPNQSGPTIVYIQCSVVVCTGTDEITRCSQGCLTDSRRKRYVLNLQQDLLLRRKRQQVDDDNESPIINVTESPIQEVARSENIQIFVVNTGSGDNGSDDNEHALHRSVSMLVIVSACVGGVAFLLLTSVIIIIMYHNKFIQPKNSVLPLNNQEGIAYVQDIYFSKMNSSFQEQPIVSVNDAMNEFVWARRVINAPPKQLLEMTSKNDW